jgi:uncharacterized FAD-dependent dehydrogenase
MNQNYDIGIIGAGVAGIMAALKISQQNKSIKTIVFEIGRPFGKRRRMCEGALGCFPSGDGKLYTTDITQILDIADKRSANAANKWFFNTMNEIAITKLIKSKAPDAATQKKIKSAGFELEVKEYYQWLPEHIHHFSKVVAEEIEQVGNVTFSFDNEIYEVYKKNGMFAVHAGDEEYYCKKLIICAGRSGWRWVNKLYRDLGILASDDVATFGIMIEIGTQYMTEFNKSHCVLDREDIQIGPINWNGSVIQEDHADLSLSAFRSNEERWKTDKVMFSLIGKIPCEDATAQTDRLAKLAFLLGGDRVGREKLRIFNKNESQLNLIPEYNFLNKVVEELCDSGIMPNLISRGYYHFPCAITTTSKINLGSDFSSEISGLFITGESACVTGLAAAGISGAIAAMGALK